jgi:hypothetical protein
MPLFASVGVVSYSGEDVTWFSVVMSVSLIALAHKSVAAHATTAIVVVFMIFPCC